MTYRKLFDLKYKQGLTTHDLVRRFPANLQQISEIALMDIPENVLREIITEEEALTRLIKLKRRYLQQQPEKTA